MPKFAPPFDSSDGLASTVPVAVPVVVAMYFQVALAGRARRFARSLPAGPRPLSG
jgi:hypothetical protein